MKTFRKYSEMPANNQCAQNFDLGCELHMNPTNQQSHVNIMNLNLSNSDVKSSSYPPVCSDSRLFDTSVNHLLTLDAECCKKSNPYPCIPSCPETPLVSEAQGLFNTLHKVGYTHPRIRTNFNSQTGTNRSHTNDKLLTSTSSSATTGRLQNKSLQFLQTVPHFIYISNPNNQLTNPKDTCLPKNLSTEPIEHAKVINQKCEHILENSHIVCQNLCAHSPSSMCQCNKKPQEDCDISDILFSGGHPTYYPNSQYQCPAHSQLQTAQEYSLKEFLPEGAKVKCDSIASSSANYESGERLANSFSNSAKYMKCCHR
ncbi:unnamed protein product [Trichobilharzia regenti]|nr:unnamed protein product [Trichobilharzia regenti]